MAVYKFVKFGLKSILKMSNDFRRSSKFGEFEIQNFSYVKTFI